MTMRIGKFEVISTLGSGASSTILKIRRSADGKVYALKNVVVSTPEERKFITQAEQEYEIASQLDHKNLAKAYAFEKTMKWFRPVGAKLLLEYVDGLPLARCNALPVPKLLRVFSRVADGLAYMHAKGFYHADLKPDNIMIASNGDVKIIDFGLAWKRGEAKGRVQGTLEFLAPEQANQKIVNGKTDIFNFGATMYRIFTGQPVPAQLRDKDAISLRPMDKLLVDLPSKNPAIPAELGRLVHQCLSVDPAGRPKTMREVRDRIRQIRKVLARPKA